MSTTAAKCGTSGSVSTGGEIKKWEVDFMVEALDATNMGTSAGNKEFIGCLRSAEGTFSSNTVAGTIGAKISLTLTNAAASYVMDAWIDSIGTTVDVNGIVTFDYSFRSTGTIAGNFVS